MEDNGQEVKIERITAVDEEVIAKVNPLLDEEWDVAQGEKFLANPDNALFLAFVEENVAGFLTAYRLQMLDSRRAEVLLYEVAVDENYQRRGIGKQLVEAVKDWARELGAENVWVLTYASNTAAMALYKSGGGEEDEPGTRMFTYMLGE